MTTQEIMDLPGEWTPVSWRPPRALDFETYREIFDALREKRNAAEQELSTLLWWLSDVMNNGEMDLGEEFYQMVDATAYTKESLIKIRRVGEEFPISERFQPERVPFWVHWEVMMCPDPSERGALLHQYAEDPDYSRDDLRAAARSSREEARAEQEELEFEESGAGELVPCPTCGEGHVTPEKRDAVLAMESERAYLAEGVAR